MKRHSTCAFLFILACTATIATTPRTASAWQNVITSDVGDGSGRAVAFSPSGDVLAGGTLDIGSADFHQILVVRLTGAAGAELWRTAIHGTATTGFFGTLNSVTSLSADSAGNAIVTGVVDNSTFSNATIPFFVGKLDAGDGHELWRQEIGDGFASDGTLDGSGNPIAVGNVDVGAAGNSAFATKRSAATGGEIWSKELRGSKTTSIYNTLRAVALDPSGNAVVVGEVENATRDFFVAKLAAATGAELWRNEIDGSGHETDVASSVAVDGSGNVFAAGFADRSTSPNGRDLLLVKLAAANGAELWRKELHGTLDLGDANSVAVDGADDVVVGGTISNTSAEGGPRSVVIKYDGATGDELWRHEEVNGFDGSAGAFVKLDDADDVIARIGVGENGDVAIVTLSGDDGAEASRHLFPAKKKLFVGDFAIGSDGSLALAAEATIKKATAMATVKLAAEALGKKILLQDKAGDASKRKLQVQVKDAQFVAGTPGGALDPTVVGATFRVTNPTTAETATMTLPAANWAGSGNPAGSKGYKYVDKKPLEGPCTSASIKNGQWQVKCAGDQIAFTLDEPAQGILGAELTVGTSPSCVLFGGTIKKDFPAVGSKPGVFQAQDAPAPSSCP
ncbi:MAG TPA: PQQ-binding-like beta-propeller repeat protein [Candidatus Binatia bacterium]|nr:PQQ-binding-like beta-propeller repeat protein [Candidatus Binatia bacterium]